MVPESAAMIVPPASYPRTASTLNNVVAVGSASPASPNICCAEMVAEDLKTARRHALLRQHGLDVPVSLES